MTDLTDFFQSVIRCFRQFAVLIIVFIMPFRFFDGEYSALKDVTDFFQSVIRCFRQFAVLIIAVLIIAVLIIVIGVQRINEISEWVKGVIR